MRMIKAWIGSAPHLVVNEESRGEPVYICFDEREIQLDEPVPAVVSAPAPTEDTPPAPTATEDMPPAPPPATD